MTDCGVYMLFYYICMLQNYKYFSLKESNLKRYIYYV